MTDARGHQSPDSGDGNSSTWSIDWSGVVGLVIIALVVGVMWTWLGGAGDDEAGKLTTTGTSPASSVGTDPPRTSPPTTAARSVPSTSAPATTTAAAPERSVVISGEMRSCRYGDNCLVANFAITGFDEHPGRFTCIYPNSQSDFSFNDDDVDEACLTADAGDTITIVVDGVRSATISEQDLDGT